MELDSNDVVEDQISGSDDECKKDSKRKSRLDPTLQIISKKLKVLEEDEDVQHLVLLITSHGWVHAIASSACSALRAACLRNAVDYVDRSLLAAAPGIESHPAPTLQLPEFLTLKDEKHKYRNALRAGIKYLCKSAPGYRHGLPVELQGLWPEDIPYVEVGELPREKQRAVWDRMERAIRTDLEDRHRKELAEYYELARDGRRKRDLFVPTPCSHPIPPVEDTMELTNWFCIKMNGYVAVRGEIGIQAVDFGPLTGFEEEHRDQETNLVCRTENARVVLKGPCDELEFAYAGFSRWVVAAFKTRDIVHNHEAYLHPLKLKK